MSEITASPEIKKSRFTAKELTFTALMSVIITICSWISIPAAVPFTLQTFGVFAAVGLLGGKKGTLSILVYVLLGAIGVPVFAEFTGGIGILLGTTGGYIIGFLFSGLVYWAVTKLFGEKLPFVIIAMVLGLAVCYAFGTIWFMLVYSRNTEPIGLMATLGWCVFPFIIPDLIKIALAVLLTKELKKYVKV